MKPKKPHAAVYEQQLKELHMLLSKNKGNLYSPILFWMEYKNRFTWDLIPTQYAYEAYEAWTTKNPMYKKETKTDFIKITKDYLEEEISWKDSTATVVRSNNKMPGNDAVALELDLKKWIDIEKNEKYRGYVRT